MPFLCLYADLMGIGGGLGVGVLGLDLPAIQYLDRTQAAVGLGQVAIGLVKGVLFGALIAVAGCYQGMSCERSAMGVGAATTRAVVASIVLVILADAAWAVSLSLLGV